MNVTDDVIGRVKGQILDFCHCWLRRATQPYQIEINLDLIWDAFKHLPKPFVTLCQIKIIQGQNVKKVQIQHFGFGWCDTCF